MGYRRNAKEAHDEHQAWEAWKRSNADLLTKCGLPPGVLRSRRDWDYLIRYGYWCEGPYGEHINKIDFSLGELRRNQLGAFRQLLEKVLSEEEKRRGSAGWHWVSGVTPPTPQAPKHDP
jgi:hypothetical protein